MNKSLVHIPFRFVLNCKWIVKIIHAYYYIILIYVILIYLLHFLLFICSPDSSTSWTWICHICCENKFIFNIMIMPNWILKLITHCSNSKLMFFLSMFLLLFIHSWVLQQFGIFQLYYYFWHTTKCKTMLLNICTIYVNVTH